MTSFAKDEVGAYELRVESVVGATVTQTGLRNESGRLERGDLTLTSGEYFDEYPFEGRQGETVTIDLRSTQFDPYVMLTGPGDLREANDDYEGDATRSLISMALPADGSYRVLVTSYKPGESGVYDLQIRQGGDSSQRAVPTGPRVERGRLASGDETLQSGEFVDAYTFDATPGQRVTLDVVSEDFDTYLILIPPRGERHENDDVEGKPRHSVIETDLAEAGEYRVLVTSYAKDETGAYELHIDVASASQTTTQNSSRDLIPLSYGDERAERLAEGDRQISSGEFEDLFAFDGLAGDRIVVELASDDFDPYLMVFPPEGEQVDNDDADGRQDLSRVEMTLPMTGRYRVAATSYAANETGAYRLSLRRSGSGVPGPVGPMRTGGRVFGVFVGISDYGDPDSNLMYTADDARNMQRAMVRAGGMQAADGVVIVDAQARVENVRRAVENVARQAGPDDTFVFFYSGHGGRVPIRGPRQAADPDGLNETLTLVDGDITDDELNRWLDEMHTRVSLVVLDSCFSGGFSKDVISAPGRMGLFSSEEDVTSAVAAKFRAGGYLSQFFGEAIGERRADLDEDGGITAVELSQYLHDRFRSDVKSAGDGDYVRTGGPQTGYQHLIVDRGSVGPYDVLFRR
jgi:hypothetical protein